MTKEEFEQLRKDIKELRIELLMVVCSMRDLGESLQKYLDNTENITTKKEKPSEQNVEDFLIRLGISQEKRGFIYLKTAILIGLKEGVKRRLLYSRVMQESNATYDAIMGSIKIVKKEAIEKKTDTFINVFGDNHEQIPTMSFIFKIVDFLKSQ